MEKGEIFNSSNLLAVFKDYYSILNISSEASNEEIQKSYECKIHMLGDKTEPSKLQEKIDIEEAFRVLSSYKLRDAYNEAYYNYKKAHETKGYEIEDVWLKNEINDIQINITNALSPKPRKKIKWIKGCLNIIVTLILFFIVACFIGYHRSQRRHKLEQQLKEYVSSYRPLRAKETFTHPFTSKDESAELQLQSTVSRMNSGLPKTLDNNLTLRMILITPTALLYEYGIDDTFFITTKDQILSHESQLSKLEEAYNGMKPLINLLIATNRGISYSYTCKRSGLKSIVSISHDEIEQIK